MEDVMRDTPEKLLDRNVYSLPLRREISSVLHFLRGQAKGVRVGLDIGFTNAGADRTHKLRFPAGAGYGEVG